MNAKNVVIIPQGVDAKIMKPIPKDLELQKSLKILDDDRIVMYLGSIHSISGLPKVLNFIPNIIKKIPNFKNFILIDFY